MPRSINTLLWRGVVVWAGSPDVHPRDLFSTETPTAQATSVPYIPGHEYYTTITYTSGVWWTCAADTANPSTYECQNHNGRPGLGKAELGTYLVNDLMTSVFVEVWDEGANWASGFTPQWPVHDAFIYHQDGVPHPWSFVLKPTEALWTIHSCSDKYPAKGAIASAIDGSLIPTGKPYHDGWAYFNALYDPPFCF